MVSGIKYQENKQWNLAKFRKKFKLRIGIKYQVSGIRKTNGGIKSNFARNLNSFLLSPFSFFGCLILNSQLFSRFPSHKCLSTFSEVSISFPIHLGNILPKIFANAPRRVFPLTIHFTRISFSFISSN